MALWVPPVHFVGTQNNLEATPVTTGYGTLLTAAATANTKGAYSSGELISSTTYDTYMMCLVWDGTGVSNTNTSMLLDIGLGASGSETTIISNLLVGWTADWVGALGGHHIYLPIFIPAATRVAGRIQAAIGGDAMNLTIFLFQGASQVPWRTYVGMDDYGVDTATSRGTSHTPGNTGAESTWASVGSTASRNYDALFFMTQGLAGVDTGMLSLSTHWEIGYSSTTFVEYWERTTAAEITSGPIPTIPMPASVPSGTQLQVRATASGTAEARDVAIYGLY